MTWGEMEQDKVAEEAQLCQSIEMTGHVGDVEKFSLCEFRFYKVLPPETDAPPLAKRRHHLGIEKEGKGLVPAVNLSQVNICLLKGDFMSVKVFQLGPAPAENPFL